MLLNITLQIKTINENKSTFSFNIQFFSLRKPLFYKLFITTILILFTRTACSRNPSIYSIYVIYVITGISRICGTGNKNICGIYSTMITIYFL